MMTYSDDLVFCASRQIPAIRAEAHTTNVQVAVRNRGCVLQVRDLLAGLDVVDLRAAVATRRYKPSVLAEANAAYHALMSQVVHQLDVQPPLHARVEDGMPVISDVLQVRWELLGVEVRQLVADALELGRAVLEIDAQGSVGVRVLVWWRRRTSHCGRAWIRVGLVLLGRGWSAEAATTKARVTWAGRGRRLRRLRSVAWQGLSGGSNSSKSHRGGREEDGLTIDAGGLLGLRVGEGIVRWTRGLVQTGRGLALHVTRHAGLTGRLLLRGRRQSRPTLPAARHDALEEIRRAVSDAGGRGLRWTAMLALRWSPTGLELAVQTCDLVLIPDAIS